jgi:hypothetical protein
MSAITWMRLLGSRSATSIICSAQASAAPRSAEAAATRAPTRRRFSRSARRSMIGIAQSSPIASGVTDW